MKKVEYREFFIIGIYSDNQDEWPHFFVDDGSYISEKGRIASIVRAKKFDSVEDAKLYLSTWKSKYKNEIKYEFLKMTEGTKPFVSPYSDDHPIHELNKIKNRTLWSTAYQWMQGKDPKSFLSKSSYYSHKKKLLAEYGYDISKKSDIIFVEPKIPEPKVIEISIATPPDWYKMPEIPDLNKTKTPHLKIVTNEDDDSDTD